MEWMVSCLRTLQVVKKQGGLVAGAGFEPAIPRLRDYEPDELGEKWEGSRPVAVQNPSPCF
jgi:hypothetical protein